MKGLLRAAARADAQVRVQLGHGQGFVGWRGGSCHCHCCLFLCASMFACI